MAIIQIDNAGLIGNMSLQDVNYESVTPDVTVARALEQSGNDLRQFGTQLFNQGSKAQADYKQARDADYIANAYIQADLNMRNIQEQRRKDFFENPNGYTDSIVNDGEKIYSNLLDNAPSLEAKRVLNAQFQKHRLDSYLGASDWEKKQTITTRLGTYQQKIDELSNTIKGNPSNLDNVLGQNQQLLESLKLSGVDANTLGKLEQQSKQVFSKSLITGMQPSEALSLLSSGAFDSTFNAVEQEAIKNDLNRSIAQDAMLADKRMKEAMDAFENTLKVQIVQGNIGEADLDSLYNTGKLNDKQYLELVKSFNGEVKKKAEKASGINLVGNMIANGMGIDPTDKEIIANYDNYFNEIFMPSIANLNPQEQQAVTMDFINKNGAVPPSLQKQVVSGLNSTNPNVRLSSANTIANLSEAHPSILRSFKDEDIASALMLTEFSSVMPIEDAMAAVDKQKIAKETPMYKEKVSAFKKNAAKFDNSQVDTSWFFSSTPSEVPQGMQTLWEDLYKTYAVDFGMRDDQAQQLAYKRVLSSFGVSQVSGKAQYMRAAPELIYGTPNGDNSWIRNQLLNDVASIDPMIDMAEEVNLQPIVSTLNSTKPKYMVTVTRNGVTDIVRDPNGNVLAWNPDSTANTAALRQQQEEVKNQLVDQMTIKAKKDIAAQNLVRDINKRFGI